MLMKIVLESMSHPLDVILRHIQYLEDHCAERGTCTLSDLRDIPEGSPEWNEGFRSRFVLRPEDSPEGFDVYISHIQDSGTREVSRSIQPSCNQRSNQERVHAV